MRSSEEMFALFHALANSDERIRVLTLEGSRVNPNVEPDVWQDYDITFLVNDLESFVESDEWLTVFGDLVFMQKPEAMALFPPGIPAGWFSYLMLFSDGVKIDLTLVPLADADAYFQQDPLIRVLLNKEGGRLEAASPSPSDEAFWIQAPDAAWIDDCANEFFMSCTYVAKGLLRDELLSANWIFEQITQTELHRMLGYLAGARNGFPVNTGKYHKWLPRFLGDKEREQLYGAFRLDCIASVWSALYAAMDLFDSAMLEVCGSLACACPGYMRPVSEYIQTLKELRC